MDHDHVAQTHKRDRSTPGAASDDTAAAKAYLAANAKMHQDMDIVYTGDPDIDFVRAMIPHHQGAIDMARVVMQYGTDERTRTWAANIIAEQEREIAEMRAWLQERGA
jgi:uncharacterized protein (DUF305 family)